MDAHELHKRSGWSVPGPAARLAAPAVVLLHPDEHLPAPVPAKGHKLMFLLLVAGVFLVMSGGGAAAYFAWRPAAIVPAVATPTPSAKPSSTPSPTITATPTPTPALSPTPTPLPSPTATPVPVTGDVTAPAAAPTADHPQIVTVTNDSGVWLRSTASSQNKKNIIAWMPKGAEVSVDQAGDFWWHGIYDGKTGYFAVSYTK